MNLPGIFTFTTDFGTRDAYVAEMKGALLRACGGRGDRGLLLIDVTHEIPKFSVNRAAFIVSRLIRTFPAGTIHLVVVDPGVGSARRRMIVESDGQFFVGPDNGVFSRVLDRASQTLEIDPRLRAQAGSSAVFDGRDLFAPAAAKIFLAGLEAVGRPMAAPIRIAWPEPIQDGDLLRGAILYIDDFGNARTNVRYADLPRRATVRAAGRELPLVRFYADVPVGEPLALESSDGSLEISVREGSAEALLGLADGDEVIVQLSA